MPPKISYVYHLDAASDAVQSGRPASILRGLQSAGAEVQQIFPLAHRFAAQRLAKKLFWHGVGRHYRADRDPALLRDFARQAEARLALESGDVIFSPGTLPISWLETDLPITFCADAPLSAMVNYYGSFTSLAPSQMRFSEQAEAAALRRTSLAIYPSEWAARSAIEHYDIDAECVVVIPFGANFGQHNTRAAVEPWIEARALDEIRLLFVGKEWERKGGRLVVETARQLIAAGLRVRVDVVGAVPPPADVTPFVHCHKLLRYSVPAELTQLEDLFRRAHFFFMPSRAEAYGMVYCEANAFALPCLATATGGVSSIVREGVNGHLLPLEAEAEDYARVIQEAVASPAHYQALALRSFDEFRARLNWNVFCERYLALLEQRVLPEHAVQPRASSGLSAPGK